MDSLNRSLAGWVCLLTGQYLVYMGYKYEGLFLHGVAMGFFGRNVVVSFRKLKKQKEENASKK